MGGTYVKTTGQSGQGTLIIESAQTAGEICEHFQVAFRRKDFKEKGSGLHYEVIREKKNFLMDWGRSARIWYICCPPAIFYITIRIF